MNYVSTRNNSNSFEFKDVFIKGLADDGGLFIPESLHRYNQNDLHWDQHKKQLHMALVIV